MPRIEFPSACAADVRGPEAADLCGAARALLGDCSPLKTTTHTRTHTHTNKAHLSRDLSANYMPIIAFPLSFFIFFSFRVKDVAHAKLFTCLLCGDSLGKQVFN